MIKQVKNAFGKKSVAFTYVHGDSCVELDDITEVVIKSNIPNTLEQLRCKDGKIYLEINQSNCNNSE